MKSPILNWICGSALILGLLASRSDLCNLGRKLSGRAIPHGNGRVSRVARLSQRNNPVIQ